MPHIIRGQLREYQHVALDWLVSMHEKNLNGILADEMGLGKTLMTISTLAWLACEKGVWGPHLIVVPTSVMLNWEMELKKVRTARDANPAPLTPLANPRPLTPLASSVTHA